MVQNQAMAHYHFFFLQFHVYKLKQVEQTINKEFECILKNHKCYQN